MPLDLPGAATALHDSLALAELAHERAHAFLIGAEVSAVDIKRRLQEQALLEIRQVRIGGRCVRHAVILTRIPR